MGEHETCPYGWTDPSDPLRFEKRRSEAKRGRPCRDHDDFDRALCDCCDHDRHTFPGSSYVSNRPNNCHDTDYNCDGRTSSQACCSGGVADEHRTLWGDDECVEIEEQCGGCKTHHGQSSLRIGWACVDDCGAYDSPRSHDGECPGACDGECTCVDSLSTPQLGECAKLVTACLEVRPGVFGDDEQCCAVAVQ